MTDPRPYPTADGSFTFFSEEFGEAYHSRQGAHLEAREKFAIPCQLAVKARRSRLAILDICYGLGYNSAAALDAIWQVNPACHVTLVALERDRHIPERAVPFFARRPLPVRDAIADLAYGQRCERPSLGARLLLGDARQTVREIDADFRADAIFLDPFSPRVCPQLWTVEFLARAAARLAPDGLLATYSCAAAVRTALDLAGLHVGSISWRERSPGTLASFRAADVPSLLPQEREHLDTRAAVPYRDPTLADDPDTIRQRRQREQESSDREPTTQWRKRWGRIRLDEAAAVPNYAQVPARSPHTQPLAGDNGRGDGEPRC